MKKPLDALKDVNAFDESFTGFAMTAVGPGRFFPRIAKARIYEAHGAWLTDLERVGKYEKNLSRGLDHFKQCGHLAYWLRRMSPVSELVDLDFGEDESPPTDSEKRFRELLKAYSNEYLAFDFCYQICRYYETENKERTSSRATEIALSHDYYQLMCHFMKYKHVSPHAMHLVYKSLFYFNGIDAEAAPLVLE